MTGMIASKAALVRTVLTGDAGADRWTADRENDWTEGGDVTTNFWVALTTTC